MRTFFLAPNPVSSWKCLSVRGDCHCSECFKSQRKFEMTQLAEFFKFFLPFWGKVTKWKGLMSSGWMGVVSDCLRPLSSAERQLRCSFERATWQRCLVPPAPAALQRGCWGREVEADRGSVASSVLLAGVIKPR